MDSFGRTIVKSVVSLVITIGTIASLFLFSSNEDRGKAFYFGVALLCLFVVAIIFGCARRIRMIRLLNRGTDFLKRGMHREALNYLSMFEMLYVTGREPSNPDRSLDFLTRIAMDEQKCVSALGGEDFTDEVLGAINALREFYANRQNFGIDNRSIKPSVVKDCLAKEDFLTAARIRFREKCNQVLASAPTR